MNDVLKFTTSKPSARLASIVDGLKVICFLFEFEHYLFICLSQTLAYETSEYMNEFGLDVQTKNGPLQTTARVINPPTLSYGAGKQPNIVSRRGLDGPSTTSYHAI